MLMQVLAGGAAPAQLRGGLIPRQLQRGSEASREANPDAEERG